MHVLPYPHPAHSASCCKVLNLAKNADTLLKLHVFTADAPQAPAVHLPSQGCTVDVFVERLTNGQAGSRLGMFFWHEKKHQRTTSEMPQIETWSCVTASWCFWILLASFLWTAPRCICMTEMSYQCLLKGKGKCRFNYRVRLAIILRDTTCRFGICIQFLSCASTADLLLPK